MHHHIIYYLQEGKFCCFCAAFGFPWCPPSVFSILLHSPCTAEGEGVMPVDDPFPSYFIKTGRGVSKGSKKTFFKTVSYTWYVVPWACLQLLGQFCVFAYLCISGCQCGLVDLNDVCGGLDNRDVCQHHLRPQSGRWKWKSTGVFHRYLFLFHHQYQQSLS